MAWRFRWPAPAEGRDRGRTLPRASVTLFVQPWRRFQGEASPLALTSRPENGSSSTATDSTENGDEPANRASSETGEPVEARVARLLAGRTIVMVGMMGAGKSSIGRRLAARLGLPFVDADSRDRAGGQRHDHRDLRDATARPISATASAASSSASSTARPKVLATGGGAFIQPETRAAIRADAISIWLKADRDLILSRVKRRSNRPLLKTADPEAVDRPADRRAEPDLRRGRHPRAVARRRPRRRDRRHPRRARRLSQPRRGRDGVTAMSEAAAKPTARDPDHGHGRARPALLRHPDRPRHHRHRRRPRSPSGCPARAWRSSPTRRWPTIISAR